jgi:radical SAM protein with 4Fe4S-binding SPASM domain
MNVIKKAIRKILWLFHYIGWVYKYAKLRLGLDTLKEIKILSIEFSSVCNLRCKYCFLDQLDRERFLDITIYEKLIREIATNPKYDLKVMEWPISGEFLVYPKHKEIVEITKKYMQQYPNFRPHIILNENLALLTEEKINMLLESGVLKQIICSVDGHDAATFEDMRPPAKFDRVLNNMRLLHKRNAELGHPVFIQINNGRDERSKGQALSDGVKEIFRMGDTVTFWNPKYWNESFNKKDKQFFPAKSFCSFVFNNVTLSSSGKISKCCMDLRGATIYADLRDHTLEEIWKSQARRQYLDLMFANKRKDIKGCETCSITNTNNDNRYTNWVRTGRRMLAGVTGAYKEFR